MPVCVCVRARKRCQAINPFPDAKTAAATTQLACVYLCVCAVKFACMRIASDFFARLHNFY